MPNFLDLEQGSQEWLNLRKNCVTATDIACIMGVNPYKTCYELWKEKVGMSEPEPENERMRKGKELEPLALHEINTLTCQKYVPKVATHSENKRFMASLDGFNEEKSLFPNLVEIKCGDTAVQDSKKGIIPVYYHYQMQWQMYVTEENVCNYVCYEWESNNTISLIVLRDQALIDEMVFAAIGFLECVDNLTPPALCDRDYIDRSGDDHLESLIDYHKYLLLQMKALEKQIETSKDRIVSYCEEKNTVCETGRLTRIITKGKIKYQDIPELKTMDLEPYRAPETISYRISISK